MNRNPLNLRRLPNGGPTYYILKDTRRMDHNSRMGVYANLKRGDRVLLTHLQSDFDPDFHSPDKYLGIAEVTTDGLVEDDVLGTVSLYVKIVEVGTLNEADKDSYLDNKPDSQIDPPEHMMLPNYYHQGDVFEVVLSNAEGTETDSPALLVVEYLTPEEAEDQGKEQFETGHTGGPDTYVRMAPDLWMAWARGWNRGDFKVRDQAIRSQVGEIIGKAMSAAYNRTESDNQSAALYWLTSILGDSSSFDLTTLRMLTEEQEQDRREDPDKSSKGLGIWLKDGQDIPCVAVVQDILGNWTVLTDGYETKMFLASEVA